MTTWYVDHIGGSDAANGQSFANRKKTLASVASAGAAAGDTIRVMGKPSTSSGINATFTNLSGSVALASALTQSIYTSGAVWTQSASGVLTSGSQPGKLGSGSAIRMDIASGFTTGKAAYFDTGTLNLSTYQQISFWIKSSAAVASGVLRLDLCSQTTGNSPVDQFTLPALTANQWHCITIDKSANCGSSIKSIRLFAVSDPGTVTLTIDDIIACKAASNAACLTLNSLISSDNANWYAVKSINGTAVRLDTGGPGSAQSAVGIWSGTTGSIAASILNPLTNSASGTGGSPITDTFGNSGSAGNQITISGGWNTTDMSTQDGLTGFDSVLAGTTGLTLNGDYITLDKFVLKGFSTTLSLGGSTQKGYAISNSQITNAAGLFTLPARAMTLSATKILNSIGGLSIPLSTNYSTDGAAYSLDSVVIIGNTSGDGITVPPNIGSPAPSIHDCSVIGATTASAKGFNIQSPCIFYNNTSNDNTASGGVGFNFENVNGLIGYNLQARNNAGSQVQLKNASVEIYTLDTNFNLGTQISFASGFEGQMIVYDWTQNGTATKVSLGAPASGRTSGNIVYSHREGGVKENNTVYTDYGTITTTGVVGQPGSGIAWKLSPSSNAFASSPLRIHVGRVACPSGIQTEIGYYAKLSSTGPNAQFRIFGGRCPGVGSIGSDLITSVSGTAWTQYTLSFTPTEDCVVDVFFESWGSSTQTATVSGPATTQQ